MNLNRTFFLPLLLAAAVSAPLLAQTSAQPRRLTLSAAFDLAQRQNLDLAAARAQRAVAEAGVRAASERPNPTAFFGAARDTPHESLFFDQPIELGSKRGRRIDLAKQEVSATTIDITALERQVRHEVRDGYFGLAHARGATAQQANVLKLAQRLHDIAEARFQAGDIAQLEVTQAELEVSRAQADLQIAQQEEKVALSDLNALLNEPATMDWDVGDVLAASLPELTLDDLLLRAGASNAEIARINQEQKVQQSQTALLKAERIPNLGLEFGVDFNSPGEGGFKEGARGQVSMELPLFSRNQGEIAQSLAGERALQGELAAIRRSSEAKVQSAYFDFVARRTEAQVYHDSLLPASQKLEQLAEDSYRAGKANILTVLSAQQDVHQVERQYLDSLLAVQSAFATLEEVVGVPLD
ncbi:MAG TPA: TolC family protein [Candidatus Acidoferrum sp.]|nr:TolC family protein [Candidatus Acidoferrum sp.]